MLNEKNSYLQYLPSVLWESELKLSKFSLERFLLVFEKILTGLDDTIPIRHNNDHEHVSLEQTVDELHTLYNPFKVQSDNKQWREEWLAYLSTWLNVRLRQEWNEYQKRRLISNAVEIYNLSGLKQGLLKYLDNYVISELRPRIAVDIGESVFRVALDGKNAGCARVVFSGPPIIHPLAVEVDRTGSESKGQIIVSDAGASEYSIPPKLWRMRRNGEIGDPPIYDGSVIDFGGGNKQPIYSPIAIRDDSKGYYVVADEGNAATETGSKIVRFDKARPHTAELVKTNNINIIRAIDMVIDNSRNYVVLDRGTYGTTAENNCKILIIEPNGNVLKHEISIIEPTAIALDPKGNYIFVADAGDQSTPGPDGDYRTTNIYKIDRLCCTNPIKKQFFPVVCNL
ncbi:MAG: hypothetical protein DWB56_05005 [Candidatus Jettenia sp.]|uniref:Putative phage tail protein n=1 Tax=Candidatus Jettenia caeni TaxID=247490 RepID=I3IIA2_9BACT|nr:phage tail protein [Candidatus Jettenia sp. AMX1]MBC6928314.1 hypothetical protein [Candidatus Jettenia sp.]GAB61447.1 putative phage tail protein [Candidatus Jettenia caeni]KAA0249925.1 MAG: hypothetical protein EDM77_06570 [Candidatus Jettenia sp. AMX1]MCE7880403.1 hypothetical protein [Candidatus Jettenia sp. AMX1]MCQ3926211.1 hypothetical protein [Candidatus Jettenia sp.]